MKILQHVADSLAWTGAGFYLSWHFHLYRRLIRKPRDTYREVPPKVR